MAWTVEFTPAAEKAFGKLNRSDAERILHVIGDVAVLDDPRSRGHALTGRLGGLWRYRVGDWRVIARIENERLVIVVIEIGHRREIYR